MSKRKTHEEFVSELMVKLPHIKVIGEYKTARTPIEFYCTIHNYYFKTTPTTILGYIYGCKYCAIDNASQDKRKTNDKFIKELEANNPNTEALEEYHSSKEKIRVRCRKCGHEWEAQPTSLIAGNGCKKCAMRYVQKGRIKTHEQFLADMKANNPKYKDIEVLTRYIKDEDFVTCKCKICGHIWDVYAHNLVTKKKSTGCPVCKMSKGERTIMNYLEDNNISFISQKTFDGLYGVGGKLLMYDFYIPTFNLLIEYQGEFHDGSVSSSYQTLETLKIMQEHDKRKKEYAINNDIDLLEIWYWDYENINRILYNKFTY